MIGNSRLVRGLFVAVMTAFAGLLLLGGHANAQTVDAPPPVQQRFPTTVTADVLPTVQIERVRVDGETVKGAVFAQDILNNTVYAGGYFDHVRPAGAPAGTNLIPRANLLAFDIRTGNLITSFAPQINGQVKAVKVSPDGSRLYVGGSFNKVNGQTRWNIAAFDTSTGQLLDSWRPAVGGAYVNAIEVTDDAVYVGGLVSAGNGQPRQNLMAFDLSGNLLGWAPTTDLQVDAMVTTPSMDKVIVAGRFYTVNGVVQRGLVALDPVDGSILDWAAPETVINGWNDGGSNTGRAGIISLEADETRDLRHRVGVRERDGRKPRGHVLC